MPKAKPVSLHPLSFDEALDLLLSTPPETKAEKRSGTGRPGGKKRKRTPRMKKRGK